MTRNHTLLAENGEVVADSMTTNSSRARVKWAIQMNEPAEGLVAEDAERLALQRSERKALRKARRALKKQADPFERWGMRAGWRGL